MRIIDWSSDVCSSDLVDVLAFINHHLHGAELIERMERLAVRVLRIAVFLGRDVAISGFDDARDSGGLRQPLLLHQEFERAIAPAAGRHLELAGLLAFSIRSEEHTSELQSLMRISYAVFCLKKKNK